MMRDDEFDDRIGQAADIRVIVGKLPRLLVDRFGNFGASIADVHA